MIQWLIVSWAGLPNSFIALASLGLKNVKVNNSHLTIFPLKRRFL